MNDLTPEQASRIASMLGAHESRTLEFKRMGDNKIVRKLLEAICAFANTEGGVLALGVADEKQGKGAARLICSTQEFNNLAKEAGIGSHKQGVTDAVERARLRAELDGLVAHLYGLTEAEFAYILTTFPLVKEPVKIAAQNAYRDVERGLIK